MAAEKAPKSIVIAGLKHNADKSMISVFVAHDRDKAYGAWIKPAAINDYVDVRYIMYTLPEDVNRAGAIDWLLARHQFRDDPLFKAALEAEKTKATPAPKAKKERKDSAKPEAANLSEEDKAKLKGKGVEGLRNVAAKRKSAKKKAA